MTARDRCVANLRAYIERADRDEIGEAQAAIIEFALAQPGPEARSTAMDDLRGALAGSVGEGPSDPMQQAFYTVVDAMIDRTREAVLDPDHGNA